MKYSIFVFLFMAIALFYFSCSDNNPTSPELSQSDQVTSTLAKVTTPFIGESIWVADIDQGTMKVLPNGKILIKGQKSEWFESADVPMVTGQSFWDINWKIEADWSGAKIWGKADIIVDDGLGTWKLSWHGWLTDGEFDAGFFSKGIIVVEAVGTGKSGVVKGMVGHWTYTMNIEDGFVYETEGYIQ
jgi:hypothetical protein